VADETIIADRYRLVRRISRTEMAEVYEAVDQVLDRKVAVKLLLPELATNTDFVTRFQREARAAASLNHPNIVAVYDFGTHESSHFIVMEFIDGPTLADVIRDEAPLPDSRAAEIGMEIAAALAAAHQQGIVHRDVKPGNVLLGSGGIVKVADFGIARAVSGQTSELTRPGTIVGSVSYVSPEQAMGGEIGTASDLYSLGAVLYVMTTGHPPFVADTPVAVAHQHVHQEPTPPTELNPDLSPAFAALVMRALAKDPAARPPSAEAMRQELLGVVEGATAPEVTSPEATSVMNAPTQSSTQVLTSAMPPTAAGRAVSEDDRRRRAALAAVVAFVLAVAVIALIAFIASAVRNNSNPPATTLPTTIAPTTTIAKRVVTTVPRTTPTTEEPATTVTEQTVPEPTFPPTTAFEPTTAPNNFNNP
jgi:serine/threonine-protein kinase